MNNEIVVQINKIAEDILGDTRFSLCTGFEQLWQELSNLLDEWEDKIEREHQKKFVTDDVENEFKRFVRLCTEIIVENIDTIDISEDKLKSFFRHRHTGYGFYSSYKVINHKISVSKKRVECYNEILGKSEYKIILYRSLAEYFANFYGRFSDNEMAIDLLCRYYPDDLNLDVETQELLINALYPHITNAGEPGIFGFAYGGISKIIEGIGNLPYVIIEGILKKYEIYKILNNKAYRRQIYTLIEYSNLKDSNDEKNKYKFLYLDSILLLDLVTKTICRNMEKERVNLLDWIYNCNVTSEIDVFEKGDIKYSWKSEKENCRSLMSRNNIMAEIYLANDNICIKFANKQDKKIEFKFNFNDWVLDTYYSNDFDNKLEELFQQKNSKIEVLKQKFLFSHIYLNNYRGIQHQQLSLDNKYSFDEKNSTIQASSPNYINSDRFYHKNIYSLSCIVGKNGTGKTSILEFLRISFFTIINLIENNAKENILSFDGEVVRIEQDLPFLKKETNFLVIFSYNKTYYIFTNIKDVKYADTGILPYFRGLLAKKNNNSKIIYFSNMVDSNDSRLFDTGKSKNLFLKDDCEENEIFKSLEGYRNVDYSENSSFINKQHLYNQSKSRDEYGNTNLIKEILSYMKFDNSKRDYYENIGKLNYDLIYQFVFLDKFNDRKLTRWLGFNLTKNKVSCNQLLNIKNNKYLKNKFEKILMDGIKGNVSSKVEMALFKILTIYHQYKLDYFSSGQYAKFSFLSKLYWCLNGYDEYYSILEEIYGSNKFDIQDTLQENDTAIIFIDEGELYYHPEWQRTYISTLIDMIDSCKKNVHIQIVIATNSPFIISDIKRNDIMYLPCHDDKSVGLTFGQNIHTLLKNNLFMDYTIGEFARKRIDFIIKQIKKQKDGKYKSKEQIINEIKEILNANISEDRVYEFLKSMITNIGEDIYREKLLSMLEESMPTMSKLEKLNKKKLEIELEIENEIKKLEEELES